MDNYQESFTLKAIVACVAGNLRRRWTLCSTTMEQCPTRRRILLHLHRRDLGVTGLVRITLQCQTSLFWSVTFQIFSYFFVFESEWKLKFDLVRICVLTVTTESKKHLSRNTAQIICHWGKPRFVILNMGRWMPNADMVAAVELARNLVAHGNAREGKWRGNWRMERVASTLTPPPNMVYSTLLKLMRTPRLPAVDWTDAPTDLNGLVRFGERRNLVSVHVPSLSARAILPDVATTQEFCIADKIPADWQLLQAFLLLSCVLFYESFWHTLWSFNGD